MQKAAATSQPAQQPLPLDGYGALFSIGPAGAAIFRRPVMAQRRGRIAVPI